MAVTPLPFLDRTAATFKTDVDAFFAQKLPQFSVDVNQLATDVQSSATAANSSKVAAATSETNAANSATAANSSKTAAATSATNSGTSATNAANSATAANTSKTAAANSATAAATSATNSEASAVRAQQAADSIGSGPVTSVNGKTGVVLLAKTDISLGSVDNVSVIAAGIGVVQPTALANIDSFTLTNGWYAVTDATLGTKPAGVSFGSLLVSGRLATAANTRVVQTLMRTDTGPTPSTQIFSRTSFSGTWGPWVEIANTDFVQDAVHQGHGVVGVSRNVRMAVPTAAATAAITADEITVETALGGLRYCIPSFSKTINLATTGAGGMNSGAAPASGYVAIYAIYNPTTGVSALLGFDNTSTTAPETAPSLPSGYTASALIAIVQTTAARLIYPCAVLDRRVYFAYQAAVSSVGVVSSLTSVNISAVVPKNAKSISGWAAVGSTAATNAVINIAGSAQGLGFKQIGGSPPTGSAIYSGSFTDVPLVAAQTMFWQVAISTGTLNSAQINISEFEF